MWGVYGHAFRPMAVNSIELSLFSLSLLYHKTVNLAAATVVAMVKLSLFLVRGCSRGQTCSRCSRCEGYGHMAKCAGWGLLVLLFVLFLFLFLMEISRNFNRSSTKKKIRIGRIGLVLSSQMAILRGKHHLHRKTNHFSHSTKLTLQRHGLLWPVFAPSLPKMHCKGPLHCCVELEVWEQWSLVFCKEIAI